MKMLEQLVKGEILSDGESECIEANILIKDLQWIDDLIFNSVFAMSWDLLTSIPAYWRSAWLLSVNKTKQSLDLG